MSLVNSKRGAIIAASALVALTSGAIVTPAVAGAAPAVCGTDCGTDAPYGINSTLQQKLSGQAVTGTARTQNAFEAAVDAMSDQLSTITGGLL